MHANSNECGGRHIFHLTTFRLTSNCIDLTFSKLRKKEDKKKNVKQNSKSHKALKNNNLVA